MNQDKLAKLIIKGKISASNLFSFEKKGAKMENRPFWSIMYKSTGETLYLCGEKRLYSNMNSIIVAPKGCNYEWRLIQSGTFSYINFDSDMTDDELHLFRITKP